MTQQGDRQASIRAVTGTALTYESDWMALFDLAGIAKGNYDERLLAWINFKLGSAYAEVNGAMQALANANGAFNFSSMGTFTASSGGGAPNAFPFTNDTSTPLSTTYTSAPVTMAGSGSPWNLTIVGGSYSINGGAFASTPTTINAGDTLAVRGTSSGSTSSTVNVTPTVGGVSSTYSITSVANTEASAFILRITTDPGSTRRGLYDAAFSSLKSGATSGTNILAKLDAYYLFAAADSQSARLNLVQTSFNATAVSAPTFTVDRGYTGDGAAAYLDTNFNDLTGSANWSQDSMGFGVYVNQDGGNTVAIGGNSASVNLRVIPPFGGSLSVRVHTGTSNTATAGVSSRLGLCAITRTSSTAVNLYRNGALLAGGASTSATPITGNVTLFKVTVTFANDRVGSAYLGQPLSTAEQLDLYNATLTYLTAIGAS